jgi:signal peptidase I
MLKMFFRDIVAVLCLSLIVFVGIHLTMEQVIVYQTSMQPTLKEGQRLFISRAALFFQSPERGDILIFNCPEYVDSIPLVKRVVGLPGETIEIKSGTVYVNGVVLEEPYIEERPEYIVDALIVPEGHYFVLGDNRNVSNDSHCGWTVPETNIIGKAWVSVWPPETWGLIPTYIYAAE